MADSGLPVIEKFEVYVDAPPRKTWEYVKSQLADPLHEGIKISDAEHAIVMTQLTEFGMSATTYIVEDAAGRTGSIFRAEWLMLGFSKGWRFGMFQKRTRKEINGALAHMQRYAGQ